MSSAKTEVGWAAEKLQRRDPENGRRLHCSQHIRVRQSQTREEQVEGNGPMASGQEEPLEARDHLG